MSKIAEEIGFENLLFLNELEVITLTGGGINWTIGVEFLRVVPIGIVTSSGFFFCFGLVNERFTSCGYAEEEKNIFLERKQIRSVINILPYRFVEL